jgi:hypothetical protein
MMSFAYWRLTLFFKALGDERLSGFKAGVVLGCTQALCVMIVVGSASLLTKRHLPTLNGPLKAIGLAVAAVIVLATYLSLQHRNRWSEFEPEFKTYSKATIALGSWLVLAVICVLFAVFVLVAIQARRMPY